MGQSYYKWSTNDDVQLFVTLTDPITKLGSTGKTPEVSIRRVRELHGVPLDNYFWNGTIFTATPTWINMTALDATNSPGEYYYRFEQSLVQSEWVYSVTFRHTSTPIGFSVEHHAFTDEIYVPVGAPVVVIPGGTTILGKIIDMEDPTKAVPLANADAVWDEILAGHLSAGSTGEALAASASESIGAFQIDVTVEDQDTNPLQGVQVNVYDDTNTTFITKVWTDAAGEVSVALDGGNYKVRLFKSGYSFTVPESLVVTADASVLYSGTNLVVITPPSAPDLCVVYGTVRDASGIPIPGACVEVFAIVPQVASGSQQGDRIAHTQTDSTGYFEIELVRNSQVQLKIDIAGLDLKKTVPDAASQDLATWP
jgi:hypothetical protein